MAFILTSVGMQAATQKTSINLSMDWKVDGSADVTYSSKTITWAEGTTGTGLGQYGLSYSVADYDRLVIKVTSSTCENVRFRMDDDNEGGDWGCSYVDIPAGTESRTFTIALPATFNEGASRTYSTIKRMWFNSLNVGNIVIDEIYFEKDVADTPSGSSTKTYFTVSDAAFSLTLWGDTNTKDATNNAFKLATDGNSVGWDYYWSGKLDISDYDRLVVKLKSVSDNKTVQFRVLGMKDADNEAPGNYMVELNADNSYTATINLANGITTNNELGDNPATAIDLTKINSLRFWAWAGEVTVTIDEIYLEKDGSSTPATDESYSITIEPTTNGTVTASKATAKENEEIELTIIPDEGYELDELTVTYEKFGSTSESDGADFSFTRGTDVGSFGTVTVTDNKFNMPKGDVTVKATFKEKTVEPTPPATYTLTVNKEWVTFCSPKTFTVPEGLKAYTVTAITQPTNGQTGSITLSAAQTIVEAGVPMLIENTNTSTTSFTVTAAEGSVNSAKAAQYKGVTAKTDIPADAYVLIDGTFLRTNGGSLPAYHCYIEFSSATTRSFVIEKGSETTAIQNIGTAVLEDDQWYTLNGIRVAQPKKGIYIRNGKKVVVR